MDFTILGSGTAISLDRRNPAGFLVEAGGARILVDGGTGTVRRLGELGVAPWQLDGGVYSHRHMDHCGDLGPLLFAMYVEGARPGGAGRGDYPIWAGQGFSAFFDHLRAAYGRSVQGRGWRVAIDELPLDGPGRAALPGGIALETRPANHGGGALHLKFTGPDGVSAVFSGDTGPSDALTELARGADLLVCECAFDQEIPGGLHLWPEALAEIVSVAKPARVAITHLYPDTPPERALAVVSAAAPAAEVCIAEDGQRFSL